MSRNDIILGVVALVLVVFSLVAALVVPRRDPAFPGRRLRLFAVVAATLVVAMLATVEVFGESHEAGGGEAAEPAGTEPTETGEEGGTGETGTEAAAEGDPAAGREVFNSVQPACGSCHTLEAAGASGTVGPNLDETLADRDAAFIRESIVNPDAQVTEGFAPGIMPGDYGEKLDEQQLADLVAFLAEQGGS